MCNIDMESAPITQELREVYASTIAEYREKALRLQVLAMNTISDVAAFRRAADEVAELARRLGDIRSTLKWYVEAAPSPVKEPSLNL
jgi:hypothetical protein